MKYRILVNPSAGTGAAVRLLPAIEKAFRTRSLDFDSVRTAAPGDARRLVNEARQAGVDCIVVVGGDGTLNEVAQGYLHEDGTTLAGPDLAIVPAGTGGDFRKTFDLGENVSAAVQRIEQSAGKPLDLGIIEVVDFDGRPARRAFLNITSFGLGGLTDQIVNQGPKWIGGKAAFFLGALRATLVYRNQPVRVLVDGETWFEGPILNVAIANGRYFGGGMFIAPHADPADGLFDVVALRDLTRAQGIGLARNIYQGTHLTHAGVVSTRGTVIEASPLRKNDVVLVDMDGETPGRLPLRARLVKHALKFRA